MISSYDYLTGHVTGVEFRPPRNSYVALYWRSILPFNGRLYAGLGNNNPGKPYGPVPTGQIWQFDGSAWTQVLQTDQTDIYTLFVWNNQLYAGAGTDRGNDGQLWTTVDGTTWQKVRDFIGWDYVRSLASFQGKLYIGLKQPADLWSFDGSNFVEYGHPPYMNAQVKTLVPSPDGSLLYVGGVAAYVYTWDGSQYTLSLDAKDTYGDSEIYKGNVYNGSVWFPTHRVINGKDRGGILELNHGHWINAYTTQVGNGQIQVLEPYNGNFYAGQSVYIKGSPLTLLETGP